MINLILFGPPGSGKGTQAKKIAQKFDLLHISTGDLFRYEIGNKTPLGLEAKSYIDKGELVPDAITVGMLRNKIEAETNVKGYILDGFPRTVAQCEALDRLLAEKNEQVAKLIMLEVPEEVLVKRLLERGKTSGRSDDLNEKVIKKRIEVYHEETWPVFEYYQADGKVAKVDGVGSIEEIFDRLSKEISVLVA